MIDFNIGDMLEELMDMSPAYDTGINLTTIRKRKLRKCTKGVKQKIVTEVMSSKVLSELSGQVWKKIINKDKR